MGFIEYKPAEALSEHIDAYWVLQTNGSQQPGTMRIMPDGCADMIVNIGATVPSGNNNIPIHPGNVYLVGTMTMASQVTRLPHSHMIGIRFRPGGLSAFYEFPMHELVNAFIDTAHRDILSEIDADERLTERLDRFFLKRLTQRASRIVSITADIYRHQGQLSVEDLAGRHHITTRSLERLMKNSVGISPKALIKIIRLQAALRRIKQPAASKSLLHIAYETGYYDHAHLTNEIKKYTGLSPSALTRK